MRLPFRLTGIIFALLAATVQAEPVARAYYIVGEVDRSGAVEIHSVSEVLIRGAIASDAHSIEAERPPRHGNDRISVAVRDGSDRLLSRQELDVEFQIRGEHALPTGEIVAHHVELDRTAFVLRIPAENAVSLELRSVTTSRVTRSRIADLPHQNRNLPASVTSNALATDDASSANRVDLLILGDGYTAAEASKFVEDAAAMAETFFSLSPYAEYRNYVKAISHFVPSAQSGADHPPCADPSKDPDPKEGTFVDTAFNASYCRNGIQRLLTVDFSRVYAAAAAVPDWDKIVVIVNDTMYGGSGGAIAVGSLHDSAVAILQHEYGHSFSSLADEYSSPYPGYPLCNDLTGVLSCEANVTNHTSRASIKWSSWIAPSTPVPTPDQWTEDVGLFTGARYQTTGYYRPRFDCMMRQLSAPFCEVCRQEYVLRLYKGWGGIPATGVKLVEQTTPLESRIAGTVGQPISFHASILSPGGGPTTAIQWFVDGEPVPDATSSSYTFTPTAARAFVIEVEVRDTTPFVRPVAAAALLTDRRSWTIDISTPGLKRRATRH
jgi:hypothetical protein